MTKRSFASLAAVFCLALSACQSGERTAAPQSSPSAAASQAAPASEPVSQTLLDPAQAAATAPSTYRARFSTTKGDFVIEAHSDWAPRGADRFYNLVKLGYYDGVPFFRVIDGFMVQFGINGSPAVNAKWREANIPDDPSSGHSNSRGMVSFATAGPNTRTTQVFINFGNNAQLDGMGFTPFGQVTDGMPVVDSLYKGYGEGAPQGAGPDQGRLQMEGNAYVKPNFPSMDFVKTARLE